MIAISVMIGIYIVVAYLCVSALYKAAHGDAHTSNE
jgi:hypothetical protein